MIILDILTFNSLFYNGTLHQHVTNEELLLFLKQLSISEVNPVTWDFNIQIIFLKILFDSECFAKYMIYGPLFIMLLENGINPDIYILDSLKLNEFLQQNPLINIELDLCRLQWQKDLQSSNYGFIEKINNDSIKININSLFIIFKNHWSLSDNLLDHMYKQPVVHFDYFLNFINKKFNIGYSWSNYSNFKFLHLKIINELHNNNNIIVNYLNNIINKK